MNDINKITEIFSNQSQMSFPDAIKEVAQGKKIHKLEWKDRNFYGLLDSGILKLHKSDGKLYQWIINDGDLNGTDWITI